MSSLLTDRTAELQKKRSLLERHRPEPKSHEMDRWLAEWNILAGLIQKEQKR